MNALLGGAAAGVPAAIAADRAAPGDFRGRDAGATAELVRALLRKRRDFGITRLGSLTRLDRAGVCVAQAVRPLSLSNAVAQGKGITLLDAAASALMEALETWAGENIPVERTTTAQARHLGEDVRSLYAGCLVHAFDAGWDRLPLGWIDGYDLLGGRIVPVPAALVDTVYTLPSPHPVAFPRTTTGLAAGRTMLAAFIHAALEILERAAVAAAERQPRFFEECQVKVEDVDMPASSENPRRPARRRSHGGHLAGAGRAWIADFHCHVIEGENHRELAPLPGEGFGCDFTHDRALAKALLEAAQARVTAISGTREDITRGSYPDRYERDRLAEWRKKLAVAAPHAGPAARRRRARLRRGGARPAAPRAPESRRESGPGGAALQRTRPRPGGDPRRRPAAPSRRRGLTGWPTTSSSSSAPRCGTPRRRRSCRHAICRLPSRAPSSARCGSIGRRRSS